METGLPLYSAAQVRALDARAIALEGGDAYGLMQRAAAWAYARLRVRWPQARRLLVLAGSGNNGGDALELARLAALDGIRVDTLLVADAKSLGGAAAQAFAAFEGAGLALLAPADFDDVLAAADVVVDGLLGTGLSRDVDAPIAGVICKINALEVSVLALDLPSGIHADTGAVMGAAMRASATVSFIGRKQGSYTGAALDYVGDCAFSELDVPAGVYLETVPAAQLLPSALPRQALRRRLRDSHKGRNGHVFALGGAPGYSGAIRLCAHAALRAGAGLVSVGTHPDCVSLVAGSAPELMVRGVTDPVQANLVDLAKRATVLAIGPGLGVDAWAVAVLAQTLALARDRGVSVVLDADALNLLKDFASLPAASILTPHPGEAGRLLGVSTAQIQADRYGAALKLSQLSNAVVVLKGAGTIITAPSGETWVCAAGNPGMAVAGMGDVLTGVIAALLAQGCDALSAACAGVEWHAQAGDLAAQAGQIGLLPSDVIGHLRAVLQA